MPPGSVCGRTCVQCATTRASRCAEEQIVGDHRQVDHETPGHRSPLPARCGRAPARLANWHSAILDRPCLPPALPPARRRRRPAQRRPGRGTPVPPAGRAHAARTAPAGTAAPAPATATTEAEDDAPHRRRQRSTGPRAPDGTEEVTHDGNLPLPLKIDVWRVGPPTRRAPADPPRHPPPPPSVQRYDSRAHTWPLSSENSTVTAGAVKHHRQPNETIQLLCATRPLAIGMHPVQCVNYFSDHMGVEIGRKCGQASNRGE